MKQCDRKVEFLLGTPTEIDDLFLLVFFKVKMQEEFFGSFPRLSPVYTISD